MCINSDCKLLLYKDDSTIMFSHKNPEFISQKHCKQLESFRNLIKIRSFGYIFLWLYIH